MGSTATNRSKQQEAYTEDAAQQAAFDSQQQIAEMQAQMNAMQAQQAAAAAPPPAPAPVAAAPAAAPDLMTETLQARRSEGRRNSHGSRILARQKPSCWPESNAMTIDDTGIVSSDRP